MASEEVEVRPTIDRSWLEEALRNDPLAHAFAYWDLTRFPLSARFFSASVRGRTLGYLLTWLGQPGRPVVHWLGETERSEALVERMPEPPFVALVPARSAQRVRSRFPHAQEAEVVGLWRERSALGGVDPERVVRRLGPADADELGAWSRAEPGSDRPGFGPIDLAEEPVWGAFVAGRLVGVTRTPVRLPNVWIVSAVYVEAAARGHGLGERLVAAAVEEAERHGAPTGLFVREDAAAARRTYGRLGFREVGRSVLFDVPPRPSRRGASHGREPPVA